MAVACHYLNAEFKLDNVCLGCQELIENHTSENLSDALQLMLLEYNKDIDISIGAIATDYGPNILKAVKNLDVPHIPCFGHSFNGAVKNVFKLEQVNTAIEKTKSIQNIFAYSWKSVREMAIEQNRFDLKQVKFPSYSKTRWWLNRHNNLVCQRVATNIARNRAEVSPEIISEYFDSLQKVIEKVPAQKK